MIRAEVVADSLSPQGDRLTSVLVTFPRIILAEVNTHRMLSKNTSSSRAIPFSKMIEAVEKNPFIPIAWQKEHKGMQGSEYITNDDLHFGQSNLYLCNKEWLKARDLAVAQAKQLNWFEATKQLCNRLLEPFMWTTMLITGSKEGWDNFFNLRCPQYYYALEDKYYSSKKEWINAYCSDFDSTDGIESRDALWWLQQNKGQAEIHMMALAESIYDAVNESTPRELKAGEWHIPFEDKIYTKDRTSNKSPLEILSMKLNHTSIAYDEDMELLAVKISTAMAARTSYTVIGEEKEIDYDALLNLHDRLINQNPLHASPMEHCARAMSSEEYCRFFKGRRNIKEDSGKYFTRIEDAEETYYPYAGWCRNFKGFIQYRHILEK